MMHNHDFDLIGAYADGTATPADAAHAVEAIEGCRECSEAHALHVIALEALSDVPAATMTDLERARLHRSVQQGIADPAVAAFGSRSGKLLARIAVAAATVAVVGFVGAQLFTSGSGSADFAEVAAELPQTSAESAGAAESSDAVAESFELATAPEIGVEEEAMDEAAAMEEMELSDSADDLGTDEALLRAFGKSSTDPSADQSSEGSLRPVSLAGSGEFQLVVLNEPVPFVCVGSATTDFSSEGMLEVAGLGVLEGQQVEVFSFGGVVRAFDRGSCVVVAENLILVP